MPHKVITNKLTKAHFKISVKKHIRKQHYPILNDMRVCEYFMSKRMRRE